MLDERGHPQGDGVAGRLAPRRDEEVEEHEQLEVRERLEPAVVVLDGGPSHGGDDVVTALDALAVDQGGAVGGHGCGGLLRAGTAGPELAVVVGERGVGPRHQVVAVLVGDAHAAWRWPATGARRPRRPGSRSHRAPATASRMAAVRARSSPSRQRQGTRRHRRGDQAADPVVAGVVHHVEQHPGREPVGQVLDERAPARRVRGARTRRTSSASAPTAWISACRLTTQNPVPSGVWLVGSCHHTGASAAQPRERVVGEPVGEERQVGQVDVVETHAPAPFERRRDIRPHPPPQHPNAAPPRRVTAGPRTRSFWPGPGQSERCRISPTRTGRSPAGATSW